MCNNKVRTLPSGIGALTQLKKLWLDWNGIAAIPPTIASLADTLKEFKVQGNPLLYPPLKVVLGGLKAVLAWSQVRFSPSHDVFRCRNRASLARLISIRPSRHLP